MDNKENFDNNAINCEINKMEKSNLNFKPTINNDHILSKEERLDKDLNNKAEPIK
jgi:hypothetical protein